MSLFISGVSTAKLAKRIADRLQVSLCIVHFGQIEPGKTKDEVLEAFGKMMFTWNLDIDLPKLLPLPIAYKMTVLLFLRVEKKDGLISK